MNIFRFINSKDIREYLRELQHQFTVPEAAFLIYMSRTVPLKEKFDAWQESSTPCRIVLWKRGLI